MLDQSCVVGYSCLHTISSDAQLLVCGVSVCLPTVSSVDELVRCCQPQAKNVVIASPVIAMVEKLLVTLNDRQATVLAVREA